MHNVTNSIIVTDLEGTILYCNEEAQHIFGYSTQELLGQKPALLYPDRDEMQLAPYLQAILNGKDFFGEWLGRRKDGTQVWVEIKTTVLHDSKGEPRGFIEVAEDISDRKQAEGALHLQQQEFQAIAEHAPDIIARFDAAYRFLYVNPAIEVATGLPPHSFVGKKLGEVGMPAHLSTLWKSAVHTVFTTGQKSLIEFGMPSPVNHRWFESRMVPERDENQTVASALVISRDITDRKRLEGELQTAKETQEARWVRLISTAIAATDQISTLVITVIQDITHFKENELTRLVNSILDALQTSHAVQTAQQETLSVAQAVREVLAQFDPQQKQAYALQVHIPEQLLVWADPHAFHQVLRNVLSNAFKYAPSQTPIMLSAVRRAETQSTNPVASVCITVQDVGPGIPLAEQPLLFQKFVRLKRDLSGTIRGTGLGLHISKKLIEAMGGDMWVESSGRQGEGSRFCFTLLEASHVTT